MATSTIRCPNCDHEFQISKAVEDESEFECPVCNGSILVSLNFEEPMREEPEEEEAS
jgi:predicted nucleic acid-binding Zn ribbon protein